MRRSASSYSPFLTAPLAKQRPQEALTTLSHYIDNDWLREAYRRTRKDAAPGVGGLSDHEAARRRVKRGPAEKSRRTTRLAGRSSPWCTSAETRNVALVNRSTARASDS